MIRTQILGRLGNDVELKTTQSGMSVANFSLGSTTKYKGEETTSWMRCVAWGKTGELIAQYCHKGDQLFCVGSLEEKSYEKEGQKIRYMELRVESFEFGAKSKSNEEKDGPYTPPEVSGDDLSDIPF